MTVPAGDGGALEALARYCLRNPVSLARLRWAPGSATTTYLPSAGHDGEKADAIDALDFVARLLAHVPDPRRHLVHYYGAYSNVVRGKLKARVGVQWELRGAVAHGDQSHALGLFLNPAP